MAVTPSRTGTISVCPLLPAVSAPRRGYGGKASKWVKKSSPRFELAGNEYEYHWYEHRGIGRVELKRKRVT